MRGGTLAQGRVRHRIGLLLLVLLAIAQGCYWSRYVEVMKTHLEVLDQYATKLANLSEDGRTVNAQDWGEFLYPLARARDFARIASRRFADAPSLLRFNQALDRYGILVDDPGILARPGARPTIVRRVEEVHAATAAAREALDREASG